MIQILTEDPNPPAPHKRLDYRFPRLVMECGVWAIKSYGGMLHIHKDNVWDRPLSAGELRDVSALLKQMADELEATR